MESPGSVETPPPKWRQAHLFDQVPCHAEKILFIVDLIEFFYIKPGKPHLIEPCCNVTADTHCHNLEHPNVTLRPAHCQPLQRFIYWVEKVALRATILPGDT